MQSKQETYRKQTVKRSTCPKRIAYLKEYRLKNRERQRFHRAKWAEKNYAENKHEIDAKRELQRVRSIEAASKQIAKQAARKERIESAPARKAAYIKRTKERLRKRNQHPSRKEYLQSYYKKNAKRRAGYIAEYNRNRLANDYEYKLRHILRKRVREGMRRWKLGKTFQKPIEYLGCSVSELVKHLESQFEPWMSWENHGQYGWHIDHIRPLARFDLTDPNQFAEAAHYTNLRPLHWRMNLSKHSKVLAGSLTAPTLHLIHISEPTRPC